jgi:hypothetical protein
MAELVHPGLLLALLATLVAVCYAPALGGGFLWDDRLLIAQAPHVVEGRPLLDYFERSFFDGGGRSLAESYFRPLTTLSYRLDYWLWAGNPTGFHVTNLLLHELNTLLLYVLLRRRTGTAAALAVASLWALAPRLTESVAWISGRTDVLASSFALAALVLFNPASAWRRWLAALLLVPALLSKEVALAAVFALFVMAWQSAPAEKRLWRLAPPLLALCGYAALRLGLSPVRLQGPSLGLLGRAATFLESLGRYTLSLLDPWHPLALQGEVGALNPWFSMLGGIVLVAAVAVLSRQRHRFVADDAYALVLAAASLGLVVHLVPLPVVTVSADRFLYLPLAAVALLLAPRLDRWGRRAAAVRLGLLALTASFAVFTFQRARLFGDELNFWMHEHRRLPSTQSTSSVELGNVFTRLGLDREALALYEAGLGASNGRRRELALESSALSLARLGRIDEARRRLEELPSARREHPRYQRGFALLELQAGDFDAAERRLRKLETAGQLLPEDRGLLRDIPVLRKMSRALQDPAFAASPRGVLLRARYHSARNRLPDALPLFYRVVDEQDGARALDALGRIIAFGDRALMDQAVARFRQRFGAPPPELLGAYEQRRRELDAALAAKQELGI